MQKVIAVDDLDTFYCEFGKGNNYLLLIHGWGQSHAFWNDLVKKYSNKYHIFTLDLPGFGKSREPPTIWSLTDFAKFVHNFSTTLEIKNPIIIGHSFGGKIAIAYAAEFPVKKLVLYSTSGGISEKSLYKIVYKKVFVNFSKHIFPNLIYRLQSLIFKPTSYKNNVIVNNKRSRRMLDIYTNSHEGDSNLANKIKTKTLILTGAKDNISEHGSGKFINSQIKNSLLVEINDAGHFAHLESPNKFYTSLDRFLN